MERHDVGTGDHLNGFGYRDKCGTLTSFYFQRVGFACHYIGDAYRDAGNAKRQYHFCGTDDG